MAPTTGSGMSDESAKVLSDLLDIIAEGNEEARARIEYEEATRNLQRQREQMEADRLEYEREMQEKTNDTLRSIAASAQASAQQIRTRRSAATTRAARPSSSYMPTHTSDRPTDDKTDYCSMRSSHG